VKPLPFCAAALTALLIACDRVPEPAQTRSVESGDTAARERAAALFKRAEAYAQLGKNREALLDFSRGIELDPRPSLAYSLRGYLHGVEGQYELAEKDHQFAVRNAPPSGYRAAVLANHADSWRRRKEFAKALALCDEALKDQRSAYPHLQRAWIFLDTGKTAQAKAEFALFSTEMKRQGITLGMFWPEELELIKRLEALQ
jgi:tetratricopeptide (TPR) repeat protein